MRQIHRQNRNGRSPYGRAADEDGTFPAKVARPLLTSRIEQPYSLAGSTINARQVRTFMIVVGQASESQVGGSRRSAMLLGNDVVDLETR